MIKVDTYLILILIPDSRFQLTLKRFRTILFYIGLLELSSVSDPIWHSTEC